MATYTISGLDKSEKLIANNLLKNMLEKLERKTNLSDIKMHFKKYSETGNRQKYVAKITIVSNNKKSNVGVIEWSLFDVFYRAYGVIERILIDKNKN